jgi:hypothetical protein
LYVCPTVTIEGTSTLSIFIVGWVIEGGVVMTVVGTGNVVVTAVV